jgi:uncharacterized Tic20 family protein
MYAPTQQERTLAMLCHIGALIGSFMPPANIIVPVVIWLLKKDQSAFVNEHGKESINFQINLSVWAIIICVVGFLLIFLVIGIFLLPVALGALFIAGLILCIVAGIKAYEGNYYRYPFIIRLVK